MLIPVEKLDPEILKNIAESYISREGTDYGDIEYSLADKVNHLLPKLASGEVVIVYDPDSESINLMNKVEYQQFLAGR